MQSFPGASREQLRGTAAFLVLFLGAVAVTIVVGSFLLHALYSAPWHPRSLGVVGLALLGFACVSSIAPSAKWARFREGLVWSLFLLAFATFVVMLFRIPRGVSWREVALLVASAPFVIFAIVYSWRTRRR